MAPPTTPLTDEVREWIAYARWLDTRQGFMQTYARKLDTIWHSLRVKSKLRFGAYEATEAHYQDVIGVGRKYPDIENFRVAWCRHGKNPSAKD